MVSGIYANTPYRHKGLLIASAETPESKGSSVMLYNYQQFDENQTKKS